MRDLAIYPAQAAAVSAAAPRLEAIDLHLDRGGSALLQGINLSLASDRCTAIMGPNGAGKSLLLRVLHGLVAPSKGCIYWDRQPLTAGARAEQAMVFQHPVMLRRSVRANLRFGLAVSGLGAAERRKREDTALAQAQLTELADRPARVLSGGEKQRLAVVRALSRAPKLLFLDEPTANLDPASTRAIEALIALARSDGMGIMLVTHDLGQARRLSDDVVFLDGGRVAETGAAAQVLGGPRSPAARD